MPPHRLALLVTAVLLLALLLLGLRLQLGWRREAARWPHHALFFAVCAGLLVSGVLAGRRGLWLLPALLLLLTMPRTKPGRGDHWRRALACALAFGAGLWGAW